MTANWPARRARLGGVPSGAVTNGPPHTGPFGGNSRDGAFAFEYSPPFTHLTRLLFKTMRKLFLSLCGALAAFVLNAVGAPFELKPGDHVALIGNGVPDRMQHHGWLETLITARFPKHDLVFRNLGFSGDEVGGFLDKPAKDDKALRNRSENFGSNDDWLTRVKADVVFAFF